MCKSQAALKMALERFWEIEKDRKLIHLTELGNKLYNTNASVIHCQGSNWETLTQVKACNFTVERLLLGFQLKGFY